MPGVQASVEPGSESRSGIAVGRGATAVPLPYTERRLILTLQDLLAVNGALLLALGVRAHQYPQWSWLIQQPVWFVTLSAVWLLLAYAFDAYNSHAARHLSSSAPPVIKAGLATAVAYMMMPYLTPSLPASRLALGAFPLLVILLLLFGRALYALVFSRPLFRRHALIVGAGWAGRTIAQALEACGDGSYGVVGFIDDDPEKLSQSDAAADSLASEHILGDRYALPELIGRYKVSTLILAITHEVHGGLLQVLMDCLELGVDIVPMPVLYERLTGRVPVAHIGGSWSVAMPIDHPGTGALWPLVKRLTDIVLSSIGLFCLALVLPLIAAAIYLDSPGPVFYTQERVGKGGRVFRVYKFRSMVQDAEKGQAVWATRNDSRVTRVGRLLRKTHLDEFPQFLNILRGEMSAVGPRPERPEFVQELAEQIPFYRVRHAVKPGMAGWGLVQQGYGSSKEDALLKLQYDLYYIKHQSLWLDLVILLRTIADTLTFRGR